MTKKTARNLAILGFIGLIFVYIGMEKSLLRWAGYIISVIGFGPPALTLLFHQNSLVRQFGIKYWLIVIALIATFPILFHLETSIISRDSKPLILIALILSLLKVILPAIGGIVLVKRLAVMQTKREVKYIMKPYRKRID